MRAFAAYRELFALTGPFFVVAAYLARLPLAMSQMGTLLLVAGLTDSYGAGGIAAGAMSVATAVASPIAGALTDRIGQKPVLVTQAVVGTAGMLALVGLADGGAPWPLLAVAAAVTGAFLPQIGTMSRVRWRVLAHRRGDARMRIVSTAFSYEGAADEASFVLGPAAAGLAVAIASPTAALLIAAVLLGVFGLVFALHPTVALAPGAGSRHAEAPRAPLLTPVLVGLILGQTALGLVFGSVQTGTTGLATEAGEPGLAGLLHGLLGVGSVVAGLTMVLLPPSWGLRNRLPVFAAAQAALALPLLAVHTVPALAVTLAVLGLALAPYSITLFSLCEKVVHPSRLGAAMNFLAATTSLGYAIGSSTAGQLADRGGYTAAYAVTVGATVLALVLALALRPALVRAAARVAEQPGAPSAP